MPLLQVSVKAQRVIMIPASRLDIAATSIELTAVTGIANGTAGTDELEINATHATNGLAATTADGDINIVDVTGGLNIGTVGGTTGLSIKTGGAGGENRVRGKRPLG